MVDTHHKKRVTTAPLTPDEIDEALHEIPPDEFVDQFDEILVHGSRPQPPERGIALDEQLRQEVREMFESIVAQRVQPIEFAIGRVGEGDNSRRTAGEALEALASIIPAAETLEYDGITALLKEIERPLLDLYGGTRRRMTKKDVAALRKAWEDFRAIIKHEGAEREAGGDGSAVTLGSLPMHLVSVSPADVRKLRDAGLETLRDLAGATVLEISRITGLPEVTAERIRAFAIGAQAASGVPKALPRAASGVPSGWMRVTIDSDVCKGRLTFEYEALGRYLEPILARIAEEDKRAASARPSRKARRKPKGGTE